jgi:hypothetical protein
MWVYALFALATIGVTILLLMITKLPVVVTLSAATICSSALILISRLELGYWDPFTAIAWVTSWGFAFAVSFVFLGVGRWLKRPFFLGSKAAETSGSARAL